MSNNLTEHRCHFIINCRKCPFVFVVVCVCVCGGGGGAWACVFVLVYILTILHKVVINVIQTNLLGGF